MDCLDSNLIAACLEGKLTGAEMERIDAHLDTCESCRELFAELGRVRASEREISTVAARGNEREPAKVEATDADAELPRVGDVIAGRFEIERELGRGGMGVVFAAKDRDLDTSVALKFLAPHLRKSASIVERMKREVKLARRVSHPRVCRIFDFGRDGERYFLSMELVVGRPLSRVLADDTLRFHERVAIFSELLDALSAIHTEGVVHRDLKPANLLLQDDGHVVLTDFGLAGETRLDVALDSVVGTPSFWAPEQASGKGALAASDVYSAGRIAQEMFGPYMETLPSLRQFVSRCLQPFPSDRYAQAMQATRDWRALVDALPKDSSPDDTRSIRLPEMSRAQSTQSHERRVVVVLKAAGVGDRARFAKRLEEHGASVVKSTPHELVAVFGLTRWDGDEPLRAARLALAGRDDAGWISIAMGAVEVQSLTFDAELERTFERASHSSFIGVVASRETAEALRGRFVVDPIDDELVEIIAEHDAPSYVSTAGNAFVGYSVEMAHLRAVTEKSATGSHLVEIVGMPGIGKTRMLSELHSGLDGARMFAAEAEPLDEHRGFSLLGRLLASRARARGGSPRGLRIDSPSLVERRHALVDIAKESVAPDRAQAIGAAFATMLDLDRSEHSSVPHLESDRVRAAWAEYLEGLFRRGPVVFLVDNLQWCDMASLELLASILESTSEAKTLFVAAFRPGALADRRRTRLQALDVPTSTLQLRGLSNDESLSLLAALDETRDPEEAKALVAAAEGNPFFLEQLLLAKDHLPLAGPNEDLPARIEAALQWRLDHLSPLAREACRAASVVRTTFDAALLMSLGIDDAKQACGELLASGLVKRDSARGGEGSYRLASELMAKVAYRSMLDAQARTLHERFVTTLRAKGGRSDLIAIHLERAGKPADAAIEHASAALDAMRRGDSQGVVASSSRALALGFVSPEGLYPLRMARAEALRFLGERDAQREELDRAFECARADSERALALRQQAFRLCRTHELASAVATAERAVDLARLSGDEETVIQALCALIYAKAFSGDLDGARVGIEEVDRTPAPTLSPWLRAQCDDARAMHAALAGDVGAARVLYERTRAQYEACGRPREAASAAVYVADTSNRLGLYDEAISALEVARRDCARLGNRLGEVYALANLAYAELRAGRAALGLEALVELERINASLRDSRIGSYGTFYRALCLRSLGRADEARTTVEALLSQPDEGLSKALRSRAESHLASLALTEGSSVKALDHASRALALFDELGSLDEDESEVVLECADVLAACGKADEAARRLAAQRARVLSVAERILDEADRKAFLTNVGAHAKLLAGARDVT